jgi:hypothetical protein
MEGLPDCAHSVSKYGVKALCLKATRPDNAAICGGGHATGLASRRRLMLLRAMSTSGERPRWIREAMKASKLKKEVFLIK